MTILSNKMKQAKLTAQHRRMVHSTRVLREVSDSTEFLDLKQFSLEMFSDFVKKTFWTF